MNNIAHIKDGTFISIRSRIFRIEIVNTTQGSFPVLVHVGIILGDEIKSSADIEAASIQTLKDVLVYHEGTFLLKDHNIEFDIVALRASVLPWDDKFLKRY